MSPIQLLGFSFTMLRRDWRAGEISRGSQATSVPSVIINGKYRTSPYMAGGDQNLLQIIDFLTRKEKQ